MAVIDSIEKLRQSPVRTRKIILAVLVTIAMAIVLGVWALSIQSWQEVRQGQENTEKPFDLLWNSIRENAKNSVKLLYERR